MNDELKSSCFQFIVHRSDFSVSLDVRIELVGHAGVDGFEFLVSIHRRLLVAGLAVCVGEVVERARVVGLQADGFGVRLYGLPEATEAAERDAEVVVRLRPVGAKSYRLAERVNGLREE